MAVHDRPAAVAVAVLLAGALLSSCASTSSTPPPTVAPTSSAASSTSPTSSTAATGSARIETNPPGDIPDNQAFVPFRASGYQVSVPEGWSRQGRGAAVVFSDKYNSVTIAGRPLASAPTAASVRATELASIKAANPGFTLDAITTVRRSAGDGVLVRYRSLSAVNPVTGKVARLAVERYEFWRAGRQVVLTLAAPTGSDNVDPWRKITDSFRWTA